MRRTADRYDPWRDAEMRYPAVHIDWHQLAPAHAAWIPSEGVILVDDSLSPAEQRCALAHELAHLDTDDSAVSMCWFRTRQESAADQLTARRLIVIDDLIEVLRYSVDPREVAAELDVSVPVLAMRWRWMHPAERGLLRRASAQFEAVA